MDTSSFTTIIFILFGVIGAYLIFTNQIEGRAKIVLIIAVLITFIVIFMNLSMFKSYSEASDSPKDAMTSTQITSYTPRNAYSISIWMYINDWNDKLGKSKNLCNRISDGALTANDINEVSKSTNLSPNIYLDSYENSVIIKYKTYTNGIINGSESLSTTDVTITIPDISIQKWVNLVICFDTKKVDTYINGKLVNTYIHIGVQYTPIIISAGLPPPFNFGNGFTGYLSNTRYYPQFLSPQEVWTIYSGGFSSNLFGNFLNQYNASFIFYENQNKKAEFYLM